MNAYSHNRIAVRHGCGAIAVAMHDRKGKERFHSKCDSLFLHIPALVLAALCAVWAGSGLAQERLFLPEDGSLGIATLDASLNEWRTPPLDVKGPPPAQEEMSPAADDFFVREFGASPSFSFTNGFRRTWGLSPAQEGEPAARICRGWGRSEGRDRQLWLDVEQSVRETSWEWIEWEGLYPRRTPFKVEAEPGKAKRVKVRVGVVRNCLGITGVELACLTTNAVVKVEALGLLPVTTPVAWRGEFALAFDPWRAGVSMARTCGYVLKVNGREVSRGLGIDGQETLREDVSALFRRGTNVIEVLDEYRRGYSQAGRLAIEVFAVSRAGETVVMAPGDWRVRVASRQWETPRFAVSAAGRIGLEHLPGGIRAATGVQPMHAGPLQVRHLGPEYPVFDCEDGEIAWRAELPPELRGAAVAGVVSNMISGAVVERIAADGGVARVSTRASGAYMIHWTLSDPSGRILDRVRTEMMVAGPVEQTFCEFKDFGRAMEERLRLVQSVDCSRDERDPRRFAEHARSAAAMDRGDGWRSRAGSEKGLSFRETGDGDGDWFAYKLDVARLGTAHVLDVDYADTREQVLLVGVKERYPAGFMNNTPNGGSAWPHVSGAVRTGWMAPLGGGLRTMRLVFFPGSRNITVSFENGIGGKRAAVCGFRLYEAPDGLPALKLPATARLFGNHCERPLCGAWGAAVDGALYPTWTERREGMYAAAWLGIANRIRFLRHMGQNLAIEGVYMYKQGFPTMSGESYTARPGFDYCYAMAKMYRRNGIRALACMEYLASPAVMLGGGYDVGEREMRAAKAPLAPAHVVDRAGRVVVGFGGMGLNYLEPRVWRSVTNVVGEICRRYAPTGGFDGLFVVNNGWWLPGLPTMKGLSESDVSYDDLTTAMFERETGIDLGVAFDGRRFARRHALLAGRHKKEWFAWRAAKMRAAMEELRAVCAREARGWKVYASPAARWDDANPFMRGGSTPAERARHVPDSMDAAGFPGGLWGGDGALRLVPRLTFGRGGDFAGWGAFTSEGARELVRRQGAVYLTPHGLNERWAESAKLKEWWWRSSSSVVYDVKPSGPAAFYDLVDVCADEAPQMIVRTWLDVNLPTAHGDESRRFALGYLSTPPGEGRDLPSVRGVQARIYPDGRVRLLNDTPHAVTGTLTARRLGFPLAISETFGGRGRGRLEVRLDGFGMTVVQAKAAASALSGEFRFEDDSIAPRAASDASRILENGVLCAAMPEDVPAYLRRALDGGDSYALAAALRSYEVRRAAEPFLRHVAHRGDALSSMRDICRYAGPAPKRFLAGVPGQGFASCLPKGERAGRRRTLSMLVRTEAKESVMLFHDHPFRYDVRSGPGGLSVKITAFRVGPGQKGYVSIGHGEGEAAAPGEWHHVSFTVDPEASAAVWVDGALVAARPLDDWRGLDLKPGGGALLGSRPAVGDGLKETAFEFARVEFREGVMDWRDIQREAAEWRLCAGQCSLSSPAYRRL